MDQSCSFRLMMLARRVRHVGCWIRRLERVEGRVCCLCRIWERGNVRWRGIRREWTSRLPTKYNPIFCRFCLNTGDEIATGNVHSRYMELVQTVASRDMQGSCVHLLRNRQAGVRRGYWVPWERSPHVGRRSIGLDRGLWLPWLRVIEWGGVSVGVESFSLEYSWEWLSGGRSNRWGE